MISRSVQRDTSAATLAGDTCALRFHSEVAAINYLIKTPHFNRCTSKVCEEVNSQAKNLEISPNWIQSN